METEIINERKDTVLSELNDKLKYNRSYWIPLKDIEIDKPILVVSDDFALRHSKKIESYLKSEYKSFYLTGEIGYIKPLNATTWLQEVDFINLEYGPVEFVYFGKNFDWLIYVSHENTVTFCGERLVEFIKNKIQFKNNG